MIHWSVYLVRQICRLNLAPVGVSSWEGVFVEFGRQGRILIGLSRLSSYISRCVR